MGYNGNLDINVNCLNLDVCIQLVNITSKLITQCIREILVYHELLLKLESIIEKVNTKIIVHRDIMGDKVIFMYILFVCKGNWSFSEEN